MTDGSKAVLLPRDLRAAAKLYGREIAEFGPVESGYRNQSYAFCSLGHWYNLVLQENSVPSAKKTRLIGEIGSQLAATGLPVRSLADPRIVELRAGAWSRIASLYHYLPGCTIPWEAYTMKHIKLLGWALADFHREAARLSLHGLPDVETVCLRQLDKMEQYFSPAVLRAVQNKLHVVPQLTFFAAYRVCFTALLTTPGRQLLHMDFVRGNILFDAPRPSDRWQIGDIALTGLLDLEKAAVGHPLVDIARTLTFLLADCSQKSVLQLRRYFLDSGYNKRGASRIKPLSVTLPTGVKCDVLETCMQFFWLYDFYKFLRSNPYESLGENYHYVRTRDILLQKNLLHCI
jgi:hypothetical protein